MISPVMFSSESVEWYTPKKYTDAIKKHFGPIGFDPFANPENHVGATRFFTAEDDAFSREWIRVRYREVMFMNPMYGRQIGKCMELWNQYPDRKVALVPSRTGTKWFHTAAESCDSMFLIKGRIKFDEPKIRTARRVYLNSTAEKNITHTSAPFDSVLMMSGILDSDVHSFSKDIEGILVRKP